MVKVPFSCSSLTKPNRSLQGSSIVNILLIGFQIGRMALETYFALLGRISEILKCL